MNGLSLNIKIIYLLLSLMILQACNNQDNGKSAADEQDPDIIKREVILSPGSQDLLNRLPTPVELTTIISEAKAPYIFSLTNPPANVSRYFTQKTKALNLGIYSIDLAYSSIYQRISESDQFLYCTGKLADDLGIGGVYDKSLPDKIKATSGSRDSLIMLIEGIFVKTSDFLRRNNRNQVAVLVAAGAYVEGLHLAASLCQQVPDNSQIAAIVFRQKESLGKIQKILGEYGLDVTIRPVADELATLNPIFTSYGLDAGKSLPAEKVAGILRIIEPVRSSMIR
jgi:hypothetical protein